MTNIEKIKAEIERQILDAKSHGWNISAKYLQDLLSFIELLEKERKEKFAEYLKATPAGRRKFDLSFLGDKITLTRDELNEICNLPKSDAPKIKGWVARDESEDILFGKGLCIHSSKPERNGDCWSAFTIMMHLPWEMFTDLKWEDEPIEVDLTIRKL